MKKQIESDIYYLKSLIHRVQKIFGIIILLLITSSCIFCPKNTFEQKIEKVYTFYVEKEELESAYRFPETKIYDFYYHQEERYSRDSIYIRILIHNERIKIKLNDSLIFDNILPVGEDGIALNGYLTVPIWKEYHKKYNIIYFSCRDSEWYEYIPTTSGIFVMLTWNMRNNYYKIITSNAVL